MTLKVDKQELNFLYNLVKEASSVPTQGMHISKRLLHSIVHSVYIKFHRRLLDKSVKIKITLTDEEAITFYLLFTNHTYDRASWQGNLLNMLCFKIHQEYA